MLLWHLVAGSILDVCSLHAKKPSSKILSPIRLCKDLWSNATTKGCINISP